MPAILNDIETQVAVIQEPVPTVAEPWRDDFNSDTLDPRWAWLNPEQMNWSLTDRPGYLRIMLEPEPAYLVQYSPSGDYVLETKLDFTPTNNIQRAGLIIRGQNDMSIALLHAYCDFEPPGCPGDGIFFDNATDGSTSGTNYATTIDIQPVMYLRLKKVGNDFIGFYSTNRLTWHEVGTHDVGSFVPEQMGLSADYVDLGAESISADFDYFAILGQHETFLPVIVKP